jgi:hypothetical protein
MNDALSAATGEEPAEAVKPKLLGLWRRNAEPLDAALKARARDRTEGLQKMLAERADKEVADITAILTELERAIRDQLDDPDSQQGFLPGAALPPFRRIVEILRPDKYADLDALVIGKRVEQLLRGRLPDWVRELVFETGNDAVLGEPAIWIWVEVDDDAAAEDVFSENTRSVRDVLQPAVRKLAIDRWPFIRFRTTSEQRPSSR